MALEQLPYTPSTLDFGDEEHLRGLPAEDRCRNLGQLAAAARGLSDVREGDAGLAQTETDRLSHELIGNELRKLIPGSLVVGEEAPDSDWEAYAKAPAGTFVWVLDAVDGSGPQDAVGYGYSSNVLLYRKREGAPEEVLMSVIVTASSTMLGWITPARVRSAHLGYCDPDTGESVISEILEPSKPLEDVRFGWVAAVAAQPKDRRLLRVLFENDDLTVITLGGAPALPALLLGKLAAVVISSPQTRHDAPLLALASGMGLHFIGIESVRSFTDAEVRGFFEGVARPSGPTHAYKPVPAMVISRDAAFGLELASQIQASWQDRSFGKEQRS